MSRSLLSKIPVSGIRPYIQSTRNTNNIGSGLVLLPRTSALTLDFSTTNATSCTINFKRESGNGLIFTNSGSTNNEYQITSKTIQSITLDLGSDKIVKLNRTTRSRGNVVLLDVTLWGESLQSNWNQELKKSKDHGCLRLIGDELYASEGAFIKGTGITIQTDPPNVCTTDGEGIKFNASCKVVKLNILEPKEQEPTPIQITGTVIFDTQNAGFNRVYCNNYSASTSSGIILEHRGSYTVPLPAIKSGQKYTVRVYVTRLDGNGKVLFGLVPDDGVSMFATAGASSKDFVLCTTPTLIQQGYSVAVWRHDSATGRVRIDRIVVEQTDELQVSGTDVLTKNHFTLSNVQNVVSPIDKFITAESIGELSSFESENVIHKYEALSKHFAIFPTPIVNQDALSVVGKVSVRGFKAKQWLYRTQTMLPNITHESNCGILICDVNCVTASPRVWLGEFTGDKQSLLAPLHQSQMIFTPSLENKVMLKQWFPNADVNVCDLPLPKIHNKQETEECYMYLEDDSSYTENLLNIWNGNNLCIVGTKLRIPDGMKYLSDYTEYNILSDYLSKCKGLISLTTNTNFKSGIIDLALSMGVHVVTNNTNYLGKAAVVRHTKHSMITKNLLEEGLGNMSYTNPNQSHNDSVIGSLRVLGII